MLRFRTFAVALATLISLASVAALTGPALAAAGYPHSGENGSPDTSRYVGRHDLARPAVFMLGDSITHSVRRNYLQAARPGWEISAVPGRDVSNAPWYVWDRLASRKAPVRTFVWALGTNADAEWTWERFRDTVAKLPRTTRVVFVTVWRDPRMWSASQVPDFRRRAESLERYNTWMRKMADARANTCLFDWRKIVSTHPQYLHDGVHPTTYGAKLYTNGITRVVEGSCL